MVAQPALSRFFVHLRASSCKQIPLHAASCAFLQASGSGGVTREDSSPFRAQLVEKVRVLLGAGTYFERAVGTRCSSRELSRAADCTSSLDADSRRG